MFNKEAYFKILLVATTIVAPYWSWVMRVVKDNYSKEQTEREQRNKEENEKYLRKIGKTSNK